jgi:hypothetical protein
MATLTEYRDSYYFYSAKASDICRQLGFVGVALIWAFKINSTDGRYSLAPELYLAGILIVTALFFDLLQYVIATLVWGWYHRLKERQGTKPDAPLKAPPLLNWPALVLFWIKIPIMLLAYGALFRFLWRTISHG